ncbi:MAG: hypothetical protein DRR16_24825 [Candidatus Parabeggiatoa sp. nov. 3]|nr:MAG: hypothetical protein DRR00_33360 [Gammaproteobacteria bacterium]RKZ58209.1 MAG: hypothetical protein DRQ99_25820 [Gammaproteobacteria bacterium]RKZ79917.1 MAG: hypothetical protein DRR16_24825 [Gammaproteobacteria bacterium]
MKNNNIEKLRAGFQHGKAIAMDPMNALSVQEGEAMTTLNSYWLHQRCDQCDHTFRAGDKVLISPENPIRHHSTLLSCAQPTPPRSSPSAETSAFFQGYDTTCPAPDQAPLKRLEEGDPLLTPAYGGFQRHSCTICGHTLRISDLVILCPCQPQNPQCQIAIHRDPNHGLHCWQLWEANEGRYCPATSH